MYTYKVDDENIIVYSIAGKKGRFYAYNQKNKSIKWVGFTPKISLANPSLVKQDMNALYNSACALSTDGSYFISAVNVAKRIDIFNNKLEHQVSLVYNDSPKNIVFQPDKLDDWHNTYAHFLRVHVDNNWIYVFYYKRSLSGRRTDDIPEMHIFSLHGKAVACYQLEDKNYNDFTIDAENNSIMCLSNTEEGYPQITRYNMPD